MSNKILFIDTETGGINPQQCSLLSIGLVVWSNKEIIDKKEIFINHKIFKVTSEALKINKIDLSNFKEIGIEPKKAINEIIDFCLLHFKNEMPITIGGHNVNFDINFLKQFFEENNICYNKYFSHRVIDTASILKYLYYSNVLNEDLSSSNKAFSFFNINIAKRHSSLGDALGTAELFTKLIDIVNM